MNDAAFADRVREAMRRTASGVAIIATDGPRGRAGMTVSSFCSLSMEPPSVIASVHRDSRVLPILLDNAVFTANALADDQHVVADAFAGRIPALRDNRFAAGDWIISPLGTPMLKGALARFDCRLVRTFSFGSHHILVGEVVDVANSDKQPLVYAGGVFQRLHAA
jgi:flavin reductase (DIM6/NTAB) family NADH-FMN oxidoreductase RutF